MQRKLGRKGIKIDFRTLSLRNYDVHLPPPPQKVDFTHGITSFGMMLNDELGDCTIAGVGHLLQMWTANTSQEVTVSDDVIVKYYSEWDGYIPGNPSTDNGGYLLDVLNNWRHQDFNGNKLLAYVGVNPKDWTKMKQGCALFGGLYIGLSLPVSCQNQNVWEIVDNDGGMWGGHCVAVAGYNTQGPFCITWGEVKQMTWNFWNKYCDEAYSLLDQEWCAHFGGPRKIIIKALQNDLQAVGA
jgi:hypothetical protein